MTTIILSLLLIASWVIIFIQDKKIKALNHDESSAPKNLNRRGVLRQTWQRTRTSRTAGKQTTTDHDVVLEVEELERLSGGLSRIKVIKITGGADANQRADILNQTAEIIETKDIHFTDEVEITDKPFNL